MARCLIIACGCRGIELGRGLRATGHAVRATTRDPGRAADLEAEGFEAVVADPDRVATLAPALHTTRLDMLLSKMLDSTVRGIVYEAAGSVGAPALQAGAARVRAFAEDSRVPHVLLTAAPSPWETWVQEALGAVDRVLAGMP